ncbi:hypothetical protein J3R83DRAFT_8619 [Lanmaoa asiatica]|nr:hypothetical protein J3R83DRAFT_8619 [Lanmaoa asiatica]
MQTFFYYVHYQNDRLHMKSFVAALWVLLTIQECLVISGGLFLDVHNFRLLVHVALNIAYKYIMAGLVNPLAFLNAIPELILQLLLTALVALPTQGFFVYRIYIFSRKNIIIPLIWVIQAIIQFVAALVYVGKALYSSHGVQVVPVTELNGKQFTVRISYVMIAMALTFLLVRQRATTGFANTGHILQRLAVFAVNTGIWTALFALLTLILLYVSPSNLLYALFGIPICPIYCNTLLANLNAREYIRGEATDTQLSV